MGKLRSPSIKSIQTFCCLATSFTILYCAGCNPNDEATEKPTHNPAAAKTSIKLFSDVTVESGITHTHHRPVLDHKLDNIMSWVCSVGAAAAAGDYNNDGLMDLYVTDSRKGYPNYLYRNNGNDATPRFTDVAKQAGVADLNGDHGTSMDCIWGDYNNDGQVDLYVVRWGEDVLFHNNGDGTFTDVTPQIFKKRDRSSGIDWANGNAAIFFDYNLDGLLDIYVGNYFDEVDLWHLKSTRIMHDDFEKSRNGGHNFLYQQQPDGSFIETAKSLGLDDPGWTLAVGSADISNDGWPDLYCADDFGPDQLFINQRNGTFRNVSDIAIGPDTKKGMNVDFGDFNNDGWLDIYVTNITTAEYLQEGNMLWHNNGTAFDNTFTMTDISLETGTYDGGWGWGAKFFDYDNDGDLDIIALNGFISAGEGNYWYDLASWTVTGKNSANARNWPTIGNRSFSGYETTRLWRNDGMYTFSQRAKDVGLDSNRDGRGVVVFDFDNDGDMDLFVANHDQPPILYQNNLSHQDRHWLTVSLMADPKTRVNRSAIGTRVTLVTSTGTQIRERDGGNGYSGQSDPRLHFGLGYEKVVTLLEVRWPDGGLQYLENVSADQIISIKQNPRQYATKLAIDVDPPKPWKVKDQNNLQKIPQLSPEKLDNLLSELEENIIADSSLYLTASTYRSRCAMYDQYDRAIQFFQKRVAKYPDNLRNRLELSCSYIDKIPTCGGVAAIVSKGTLAKKSLNHLDRIIKNNRDLWVAFYCRGMNHLHWPRALLHSNSAVKDFLYCIELQKKQSHEIDPDYFVRVYIALGDAYTKAKKYDQAKRVWKEGLVLFPENRNLQGRLAIMDQDKLLQFVENKRSLEQPIDTSLSFLDQIKH